jgi:hypothetical protein
MVRSLYRSVVLKARLVLLALADLLVYRGRMVNKAYPVLLLLFPVHKAR